MAPREQAQLVVHVRPGISIVDPLDPLIPEWIHCISIRWTSAAAVEATQHALPTMPSCITMQGYICEGIKVCVTEVDFMCQPDWAMGCLMSAKHHSSYVCGGCFWMILTVNQQLRKRIALPEYRWASSNQLKAWPDQKGWLSKRTLLLPSVWTEHWSLPAFRLGLNCWCTHVCLSWAVTLQTPGFHHFHHMQGCSNRRRKGSVTGLLACNLKPLPPPPY